MAPTDIFFAGNLSRKTKTTKARVRLSDPGAARQYDDTELDELGHDGPIAEHATPSTGLTPMVRRTMLAPTRARTTRRRHSAPVSGNGASSTPCGTPVSGEVRILPLSQVLDGRIQRRIRRNGLSDEMNRLQAERRRKAVDQRAELERLRTELQARDDEIRSLRARGAWARNFGQDFDFDETMEGDAERIFDLEQELGGLRQRLLVEHQRTGEPCGNTAFLDAASRSPSRFDRITAAQDPLSDDFMQVDMGDETGDEAFGDATVAELACSTPTRVRSHAPPAGAFLSPPVTSPAIPPPLAPRLVKALPGADAGVQASLPDLGKKELELEVGALRRELSSLTGVLEGHAGLTSRLADKLSSFEPSESKAGALPPGPELEGRVDALLRTLSDRTASLVHLNASLSSLGGFGHQASSIVSSLASAFRTARLELEYLSPGEVTLPLTCAGAEVLDMLLTRLRQLAKRARESDDQIDEYHALELSLRQQLMTRVSAMDELAAEVSRQVVCAKEKDARISELEKSVERLKGAVKSYAKEVAELEGLAQRTERDLKDAKAMSQRAKCVHAGTVLTDGAELSTKAQAISKLEEKLASAVKQTSNLQEQLADVHATHAGALADMRATHKNEMVKAARGNGKCLAERDARITELRHEIGRVNGELRDVREVVRQLRVQGARECERAEKLQVEKEELEARRESERKEAKHMVEMMRAELERLVQMGEGLLKTPRKHRPVVTGNVKRHSTLGVKQNQDHGDGYRHDLLGPETAPRLGRLFAPDLARNARGKARKRFDSGLGFLDEEQLPIDV